MPVSFTELTDQIELNEKRLEFEYKRYEGYYSRFTLVSILYSVQAIYVIQLIKFCFSDDNLWKPLYDISFCVFVFILTYSIYHGIRLLMPKDVAFLDLPKSFYKDLREQYEHQGIIEETELNEYLRASYNSQLEEAVASNDELSNEKGKHYFRAFWAALSSIIPYLICTLIYLLCPKHEMQGIELKNYKEVVTYIDSIQHNYDNSKKYLKFDSINKIPSCIPAAKQK